MRVITWKIIKFKLWNRISCISCTDCILFRYSRRNALVHFDCAGLTIIYRTVFWTFSKAFLRLNQDTHLNKLKLQDFFLKPLAYFFPAAPAVFAAFHTLANQYFGSCPGSLGRSSQHIPCFSIVRRARSTLCLSHLCPCQRKDSAGAPFYCNDRSTPAFLSWPPTPLQLSTSTSPRLSCFLTLPTGTPRGE